MSQTIAPPHRMRRIGPWLAVLGMVIGIELFLRSHYGFCDTVLMRENPHYEYIARPDQDRWRFRHHIRYNSLSMRSEEPDSAANILLGCGDSVINGGVLTDQDSLATTLLSDELSTRSGRKVQFLNISAGSWGPDNCLAYLQHAKLPVATAIVLFVSSHDAHDNMSFKKVVGVNKSFPNAQYPSAILELLDRYVIPRIWKWEGNTDADLGIDKGGNGFNSGFGGLKAHADKAGIPLVIYLHAERSEIEAHGYNEQGQEIIRFAREQGIHLIQDLDHGVSVALLRDDIHPDERGQRKMADIVSSDMASDPAAYGSMGFAH